MADGTKYETLAYFFSRDDWGRGNVTADTVLVEEGPRPSGILDAAGKMLYHVPERIKLGYLS